MVCLLLAGMKGALALSPDCPIVSGKITTADGATSDPSATGWTSDGSAVPNALYFAAKSKRFHAENIGGVGIWRSNVFSTAGYADFQLATKIHSEGDLNSSEYVRVYYKINGGSEVLMAERTGNFGTLDLTSVVLTGNTVQFVIRIYNYDNGGSQTSKYYIEDYRVFREKGPCSDTGGTISISASASTSVLTCATPSTTLTASSSASGVTYSWTGPGTISNPTSATITVSTAGTYVVTGTNSAGTGTASVTVTDNKTAPDLSATGGTLSCGSSVVLNASSGVSGATYRWTGPNGFTSTTRTPSVSTAGSYTVTVTNPANGCTTSSTVSVTSGTSTSSAFWQEDFTGLANGLTSDTGTTAWTTSTTGTGTFSVQNSKFMASFSAGNTAEGVWTSANIDISNKSNVVLTVDLESGTATSSDAFEDGDYIKVFYKLNGGAETQFFSDINGLNSTTSGTATAIATSPALNGSSLQIVIRLKNSDPTERYYFDNVKFTGTNSAVTITTAVSGVVTCANTAQITATPPGGTTVSSYAWTGPNGFTSTVQNPTVSAGGQYQLTATLSGGCTVQVPVTVTENKTAPDLTASGGSLACVTSFTLNANSSVPNATYSWTGPNSFTSTVRNPAVTVAGNYTVTVRNPANGCTATQTVQVTAAPTSTIWLEDFTGLADGTTSDAGATAWSRTVTAGHYAVSGSRFRATNMTTAIGSNGVWTSSVIPISGLTNVSFTLDAWSSTTDGALMNGAGSTDDLLDYLRVYHKLNGGAEVLVSEKLGSINSHSTTATVISSAAVTGSTLQIIIKARATGGDEFYYFDNVKVSAAIAGTVNASASVSGPITCATASVTLLGSSTTSGVSYSWTGPNSFTSTAQNPTVSVGGTYNLTVSTPAGCTGVALVTVEEDNLAPTATAGVSGSLSCSTTSVTLQGGSNISSVTYRWTGPNSYVSTSQNPVVSTPGVYTLTVTDPTNGCVSTAQSVTVASPGTTSTVWLEDFTGLANGTTSDNGTTAWSRTTTGGTYAVLDGRFVNTNITTGSNTNGVWTSAAIPISGMTNVNFMLDVWSSVLTGAVMNGAGSGSDVIDYLRVYYKLNGGAEVLVSEILGAINNHSTTATVISSAAVSGSTLQIIIKARATGSDEFYYFDNVKVSATTLGSISASASVSGPITCASPSATLSGSSTTSGVTYRWTGPNGFTSSAQNPTITAGGLYTLTVSTGSGCTGTATVNVAEDKDAPSATASVSGTLTCATASVTLQGSSTTSGVTYAWAGPGGFSSTSQNPVVSTAGVYTLIVTNPVNGCVSTSQTVTVPPTGTATAVWLEDFTGLANGTTGDNGATAWSRTTTGGTYAVLDGRFVNTNITTGSNTTGVWTSAAIPISGLTNVSFTLDVWSSVLTGAVMNGAGAALDVIDYLRVYYKLNGGSEVLVSETLGAINNHSTTATVIASAAVSGSTLQIIIKARATGSDEFYYFDNVKVVGATQTSVNAIASVSGPITCTNPSVTLSGSSSASGVTYSWTGPGGFTSSAQNPSVSTAGLYTLTVSNGGCTGTATVMVVEDRGLPGATVTKSGSITCNTSTVTLTAAPTATGITASYSWTASEGGTITNPTSATPTVSTAGTYTVVVQNTANGCTSAASVSVTQDNAIPADLTVTASGNITCQQSSVTLTASSTTPGVTYSWSGGQGTGTITNPTTATPTVSTGGTYTVIVRNPANGCSTTKSVTVAEDKVLPTVTAESTGTFTCANTSVTLVATPSVANATYQWSGPNGFTSTLRNPSVTVSGTYTVVARNPVNGCMSVAASVATTGNTTAPGVTASASNLTCSVLSVTLQGNSDTPGVLYSWTGPLGYTSAEKSPATTVPGNYTLTVTNPVNGCSSTMSVSVAQDNGAPTGVTATASGPKTCSQGLVTLYGNSATPNVRYAWTGPFGFSSTQQNTSAMNPGLYQLRVTNLSSGCYTITTVTVVEDIISPENVSASASGDLSCRHETVTLTASSTSPSVNYYWSGPHGFNASTASVNVSEAGDYMVIIEVPDNACAAELLMVTVLGDRTEPQNVTATGGVLSCASPSVTLGGSSTTPGVSYQWTSPNGFFSTERNPTVNVPGVYTLTVTHDESGCTQTATASVGNGDTSIPGGVTISGPDVITCSTGAQLTASAAGSGVTYQWTGPVTIPNPNVATIDVTAGGTYTVTVRTTGGCSASASKTVAVNNTQPIVTATAGRMTCVSTVAQLTASSTTPGVIYSWSGPGAITNPTSATASTTTPGNYTVTVTDPVNSCTAAATVVVEEPNTSVPNAGTISSSAGFILTCYTSTITLSITSTTPGATFTWMNSNGAVIGQSQSQVVTAPDTYLVMITNPASGCTFSRTRVVTQNLVSPTVSLVSSGSVSCRTPTATLTATSSGSPVTFTWSGTNPVTSIGSSGTTGTASVAAGGTYTVAVRTAAGCTATASTTVAESKTTPANVTASADGELSCGNPFVTLTGSSSTVGVTYSWTGPNGFTSTQRETITTVPGEYTLTVTHSASGCAVVQTVTVGGEECTGP